MSATRLSVLVVALMLITACSTTRPAPAPQPADRGEPSPPAVRPSGPVKVADTFESRDFVVTMAKSGDTPETLAGRHLGDPKKKWMIEDYMGTRTLAEGQEVVIPKREWNPVGVFPRGYQLVPVLVYHNISAQEKGRLSIAARTFDAQIRQLHDEGFHAVGLADFLAFTAGRRQLPRKSVLLTFDDGYRSFVQYARPILKDYGFGATLFVYSDFIGGGSALSWQDLKTLTEQGFDVQAHSKSHQNLRRKEGESEAAYAKRLEAELAFPATLFKKHLGRSSDVLAYPFGEMDDELLPYVGKYGYSAAFTVRRQSNPAFVSPLKISRSQIYSDMTAKDFARNLVVFQDEEVKMARTADARLASAQGATQAPPMSTAAVAARGPWSRERLAPRTTSGPSSWKRAACCGRRSRSVRSRSRSIRATGRLRTRRNGWKVASRTTSPDCSRRAARSSIVGCSVRRSSGFSPRSASIPRTGRRSRRSRTKCAR